MIECAPGTWRDNSLDVAACVDCPPGRYREDPKGRFLESCPKCPQGRYVNVSGSDDLTDCLRCPAGRFTLEDGMRLCDCITPWSCGDAKAFKRDAVFTKCFVNDPSSTCDPADEETYSTFVRETSRFHLCFDTNDMFERRASQDLFDVEDPLSCT